MRILPQATWRTLERAHTDEAHRELDDIIDRRTRGIRHPIDDFLFHYYNLRPGQLARWHPGIGTALEGAEALGEVRFHRVMAGATSFDATAFLASRSHTVSQAGAILKATAAAEPRFGCFGFHEWAMVYRLAQGETRHPYLKLRFPPDELAEIVERVGCRCSHFDAFRFFTPPAKPLNLMQPTRDRQIELDQPGCLHVNMDLYKWAGKLSPAVGASLLLETFKLARDIRIVDMAASAYDLKDWGLEPVRVETPEGRLEYARLQRGFAERAAPLRAQLIDVVDQLTAIGEDSRDVAGHDSGDGAVPGEESLPRRRVEPGAAVGASQA